MDATSWLNLIAAGACLLIAYVAFTAGSKNVVPTRFGAFLVWLAGLYLINGVWDGYRESALLQGTYLLVLVGLAVTSVRLGLAIAHNFEGWSTGRKLSFFIIVATVVSLDLLQAFTSIGLEREYTSGTSSWFKDGYRFFAVASSLGAIAVIGATWFTAPHSDAQRRRSLAVLSLGHTGLVAGAMSELIEPRWETWNLASIAIAARSGILLLAAFAWLAYGIRIRDRFVTGLGGAMVALYAISAIVGVTTEVNAMYPVMRVVGLGFLATAVLSGQMEGLDRRIRFGISKSTLAAMFVAVFFVVSEGATALFSEKWGNGVGIVAAGALVFGIAPLMRFADRFAAAAVPQTNFGSNAAEIFEHAVQAALADGHISVKEELHLAQVAEKLGLGPAQAAAIRHGVGVNDR